MGTRIRPTCYNAMPVPCLSGYQAMLKHRYGVGVPQWVRLVYIPSILGTIGNWYYISGAQLYPFPSIVLPMLDYDAAFRENFRDHGIQAQ